MLAYQAEGTPAQRLRGLQQGREGGRIRKSWLEERRCPSEGSCSRRDTAGLSRGTTKTLHQRKSCRNLSGPKSEKLTSSTSQVRTSVLSSVPCVRNSSWQAEEEVREREATSTPSSPGPAAPVAGPAVGEKGLLMGTEVLIRYCTDCFLFKVISF